MFHYEQFFNGESDPNVVFAELDKGLHSLRIGEQCAAIVRYPELFEDYPFPIMIKSSFVKLSNVFRSGTNFLRLCVVQVAEQSSHHLEKLGNVDEIVRSIHSVIYSNDPVARLLSSMAGLISEQKFVHHSILSSLESHDKVEVLAALTAASAFAAKSQSFASIICCKLLEMIDKLSVPVDMKARFIHICKNMMCDAATSYMVRNLCLSMLKRYPSNKFVTSVLHTLTLLSCRSLVHLSEQVSLLQTYLIEDGRTSIKQMVLRDLKLLASKAPHVWTSENINVINRFIWSTVNNEVTNEKLHLMSLQVLSQLSSSTAVVSSMNFDDMKECYTFACYHPNLLITIHGLKLYIDLSIFNVQMKKTSISSEDLGDDLIELMIVIDTLMIIYMGETSAESSKNVLKEALIMIQKLCQSCPFLIGSLVDHVISFVADDNYCVDKRIILCDFLSSIHANSDNSISTMKKVVDVLLTTLKSITDEDQQPFDQSTQQFVTCLIRVILQYRSAILVSNISASASCTNLMQDSIRNSMNKEDDEKDDDFHNFVTHSTMKLNGWMMYRVGRQLARYAYHKSASAVFSKIRHLVYDERRNAWMDGLNKFSKAESLIRDAGDRKKSGFAGGSVIGRSGDVRMELLERLTNAVDYYQLAVSNFKASACLHHSIFQITYTNLRCKFILCCIQVLQSCCSFQTVPPPAIATSLAINTGQESHKCEHVLNQFKSCIEKLLSLEKEYSELHSSCFDADQRTLQHIDICLEMCRLILNVLKAVLSHTSGTLDMKSTLMADATSFITSRASSSVEDRWWRFINNDLLNSLQQSLDTEDNLLLSCQIIGQIEQAIYKCTQFPLHFPRFFFQKLQATDIRLAISPPMKSPDDVILVKCDTLFAIKVEGIVSSCAFAAVNQQKIYTVNKRIRKVQLTVSSEQTSGKTMKCPPVGPTTIHFVERCPMQTDYVCHRFLIPFPTPGYYQICIDAKIVDVEERVWSSCAKSFLMVQAYDEVLLRQQQQQQQAHA
ncbi:hypothetical protein HELRODRAFT_190339 [Helobdella robusta]|uniref:Integrator complex subunit 7 n=1 Tax=Helobdella robusta TaxID=6412 RepID=T1FRX1_HELRO|nr:hypothetical protein HELRODRAFT_190339 [Helobdella robusta]ESO09949.1 hypothetical protein HELRODRAFT_190339 [Helobdella robusta]